uniref:protein quaking-A-like isoform X2 n=1 Tax=Styela clava TaxID=7725 RepID=UPI001939A743|nr:protein quaking-A-like isoform X2 [Styela clava]
MNLAGAQTLTDFGVKFDNQTAYLTNSMTSQTLPAQSAALNMVPLNGFASTVSQPLSRISMAPSIQTFNSTNSQISQLQSSTSRSNGFCANTLLGATQALMQSLPHDSDSKTKERCNYLQQLLKDKKQCQSYPSIFLHVERLLDEEIVKVRSVLFQNGDSMPLELPVAQGPTVILTEKVYVPIKEHPEYNFVGRILGPRGLTAKQLEQEAKCKIMVRGKGSMRDKKKEEMNRGKPNWEHLNDDLHVLITVEDTENRAHLKMKRAVEEIKKLLVPAEGEDDLKKKQLMELAIINGTYRDFSGQSAQPRLITAPQVLSIPGMRSPPPGQPPAGVLSTPIITRLPNGQTVISNATAAPPPPPLISPPDGALYYTPFEYPYTGLVATQGASLLEYSFPDPALLGAATPGTKIVRQRTDTRVHPYQRSPGNNNLIAH